MKHYISIVAILLFTHVYAQKETFDLATYTIPAGWKKSIAANSVQLTKENKTTGSYCIITVSKAVAGTAVSKDNFDASWETLIKPMVTLTANAEMLPVSREDDWEIQTGYAPFELEGNKGVAMLLTATGFGRMMNIIILTNSDVYEKNISDYLSSISLQKPAPGDVTAAILPETPGTVVGAWKISGTDNSDYAVKNGINGYKSKQYVFNTDGTYLFYTKFFEYTMNQLLLLKESGSYEIKGDEVTVTPKKSVIESWSKKDGTDKWGTLLSSKNRELEKTTYKFKKHYFSGITQWNLVLQADKPTLRDGPYSNNQSYTNAWYYAPISPNNPLIDLPGEPVSKNNNTQSSKPVTAKAKPGFTFTTTNFDDGWTATEKPDWVEVNKGIYRVLIHYPNATTDKYNPSLMDGLTTAWNILVAPRYNAGPVAFKPISSWQSIEYAEAAAVEKGSGKNVFVVLFKVNYSGGNGKYLEFISPDKKSFEDQFGPYHSDSYGWEKMETMANYNKFAVAASDLIGTWTNNFSGVTQYVYANTGLSAGMDTHSSAQEFNFTTGNQYKWNIAVASGRVGNLKFQGAKSNGNFKMTDNWHIYLSDIEGKPRNYDAYFSCIKGLRILWIDGTAYAKKE